MSGRMPGYLGLTLLAALWLLPWERLAGQPFPAHMVRHMGLVAVAAPLLVVGFPGIAALVAVPALAATIVEFAVVWGWHLPGLHVFARLGLAGFALEQAMFLAAGLALWSGALARGEPLAGAGALLLTSMHMTLLGALLILAPRDLYAEICGTAPDLTGQQRGGLLMLALGAPVYIAGGVFLVRRALRSRSEA